MTDLVERLCVAAVALFSLSSSCSSDWQYKYSAPLDIRPTDRLIVNVYQDEVSGRFRSYIFIEGYGKICSINGRLVDYND